MGISSLIKVHPECSTWCYPIIYQKNAKRFSYASEYPSKPTGKFWVRVQNEKEKACQLCKDTYGHKIKVELI
jgi:hypothetical protein